MATVGKIDWVLWVKCEKCDRVCATNSPWYYWWLCRYRVKFTERKKTIVRCPEHVTRKALATGGVPGWDSRLAMRWLESCRDHLDDDPQPGPLINIVFPTRWELELFKKPGFTETGFCL